MHARADSRECWLALSCVLHSQQQRREAHREAEAATPGAPAMVISLPSAAAGEHASCHRVGSHAGGTCTGVMRPVASWLPYALPYTLLLTPATDKSTLMGKDCRSINRSSNDPLPPLACRLAALCIAGDACDPSFKRDMNLCLQKESSFLRFFLSVTYCCRRRRRRWHRCGSAGATCADCVVLVACAHG